MPLKYFSLRQKRCQCWWNCIFVVQFIAWSLSLEEMIPYVILWPSYCLCLHQPSHVVLMVFKFSRSFDFTMPYTVVLFLWMCLFQCKTLRDSGHGQSCEIQDQVMQMQSVGKYVFKKKKNTVKCTHSDPVLMLFQSHKSNSSGLEMKG